MPGRACSQPYCSSRATPEREGRVAATDGGGIKPQEGRHTVEYGTGKVMAESGREPETGIEPVTPGLRNQCSTAELLRRDRKIVGVTTPSYALIMALRLHEAPSCPRWLP